MLCPTCKTDTKVIETRVISDFVLYRRRKCLKDECGTRFTTHELIVEDTIKRKSEYKYITK